MGDELTNAALIGLIGMFGIALVLRAAGSITAFLTGLPQPDAGPAAGLGVLFNPADPATALGADGLNPILYWLISTVMLGGLAAGTVWVWIRLRHHTRKTETDPHRLAGTATSQEVKTAASAKALLHRADTLRPSLESPTPEDVGYLLGASRGTKVWASVEDSILLIGPPRSGKGLHVVINAILDAPGAVVTTSTRPDNLTATLRARRRRGGPVAVFDPQRL
ncbi:type IV secretory system conjugative DNA transfer family protein, partial [Propionibacterium freudenreichii]